MARSLNFFQVYYKEEQKSSVYDFAIPYFSEGLTPFFENAIIAQLVPKSDADLISVCSWRLSKKRIDRSMQLRGQIELTREKILSADFDIAVLTPTSNSHRALEMATNWHPGVWTPAINSLRDFIKIPNEIKKPIYENHFIATKEIYHDYVHNCLTPAMDFIRDRKEFFSDSGYAKRKTQEERDRVKHFLQREDYPIAPFILERLFSIWINNKDFKIINL